MLSKSPKSRKKCSMIVLPNFVFIYLANFSDFYVSLAPIITRHPCSVRDIAVYLPIPVLPPVNTAVNPYRLGLNPLYMDPMKYRFKIKTKVTAAKIYKIMLIIIL